MATGDIPTSATSPGSVKYFQDVHAFLQAHAQAPSVRTQYYRTAFQHSESNSMRISVDEDVCMFAEHNLVDGEQSQIQDILSTTRQPHQQCTPFRYCIVEVKLTDEDASLPWISDLQAAGLLVPAPK
jgi:SPX domain protein involved in polyphosphate accumulation